MRIVRKTLRLLQALESQHPSVTNEKLARLSGLAPSGLPSRLMEIKRAGYVEAFGYGPRRLLIITPKGVATLKKQNPGTPAAEDRVQSAGADFRCVSNSPPCRADEAGSFLTRQAQGGQ